MTPKPSENVVAWAEREVAQHGFVQQLGTKASDLRAVHALFDLLRPVEDLQGLQERADWLEDLGRWVMVGPQVASEPPEDARTLRLKLLLRALELHPELATVTGERVGLVLQKASGLQFFASAGIPLKHGFFSEAASRVGAAFIPSPRDPKDLGALCVRMFSSAKDAAWLVSVEPSLLSSLLQLLLKDVTGVRVAFGPVRAALLDATAVLAQRAAALGLADDVRARVPDVAIQSSPFLKLPFVVADAVRSLATQEPDALERVDQCRVQLTMCRRFARAVFRHLEAQGVSVDLVFRVDTLTKGLDRLEATLGLLAPDAGGVTSQRQAVRFLANLVQDAHREQSLRALFRGSSEQLARKIVEHTGESGEHYITTTRAEYFRLLGSAAGGGVLTAVTSALKYVILWLQLPRFFEGLFASCNYAGTFLLMQALGFTLATKQPSMTAASLAAALEGVHPETDGGTAQVESVVQLIARIVRSQLAAAVGNVGLAIPAAVALNFLIARLLHHPFLDPATAHHVFAELDPIHGWAIPSAMLTGVFLWGSSVAGGWVHNWAVFKRIPQALAEHRTLRRMLGTERAERWALTFGRNISGIGVNVTLGLLLGMTPAFGQFFGVPLQVRHVTLSTASLAFAMCSLGWAGGLAAGFLLSAFGLFCVLLCNFGVSFALAFLLAVRARKVTTREQFQLGRALLSHLWRMPRDFFWPPRTETRREPAAEVVADG